MNQLHTSSSNREWWAQKWLEVLESFGRTLRSGRAHTYAREGHVLNLEFIGAKVVSLVQGTASDPYQVSIKLEQFTDEQWEHVIETLAHKARFAAKLLAGEMPGDIELAFTANGLSLFPFTKFDIHSRCTCPDPARVCKHVGAVFYLLGDRFSEDPFILFQLRGRNRQQILTGIRQHRQLSFLHKSVQSPLSPIPHPPSPDLDLHPSPFWEYPSQLDPSLVVITPAFGTETVLSLLGSIPFPVDESSGNNRTGTQMMMKYLEDLYQATSQKAAAIAMEG